VFLFAKIERSAADLHQSQQMRDGIRKPNYFIMPSESKQSVDVLMTNIHALILLFVIAAPPVVPICAKLCVKGLSSLNSLMVLVFQQLQNKLCDNFF